MLDNELEILRDHFPNQHNQLNATFDAATNHRAAVDELNTLITYLSNKVGRLEKELDEQQTSELEKLKVGVTSSSMISTGCIRESNQGADSELY